jgi:Domain of unknown function (DUF4328)
MEYRLLQAIAAGQFDSDAEMTAAARANDLRQGIIGVAYIVLLLATSVVVLVWIYGANRNAHIPLDLILIAIIDRIWHMQAEAASPPPESAIEPAPAT